MHVSAIARLAAGAAFGILVAAAPASAEPMAMVEDITAERDDLQLMDYLEAGRTIELAAGETLVVGYLLSCVQETITGGTVTIGEAESTVAGGSVERAYIDCDGGSVVLAEGQDQEAGAAAYRKGDDPGDLPKPDRVIYALSPLVRFAGAPETVTVTRLDADEPPLELSGGAVIDAATAGITLERGGTYRFESGDRVAIVKVSSLAESAEGPAISRLVPM